MYAIGIDVGGTKMRAALIDESGCVLNDIVRPTAIEQLSTLINDVRAGVDSSSVAGIGVGMAGVIDALNGCVLLASNLDLHNYPLRDRLQNELAFPVAVENDARAAVIGEWRYGVGQGCDDLVRVTVGTGIGGGIVSGGQLLHGSSNTAGEIGHITLELDGPPCSCGNWGCFEAFAGGWAIAQKAQRAAMNHPLAGRSLIDRAGGSISAIDARVVAEAARDNDPFARDLFDDTIKALVAGCASLINAYNPSRLILSGGIIDGYPELVEIIDRGVRQRALHDACSGLQVMAARLGNDAAVIGAAALVLH